MFHDIWLNGSILPLAEARLDPASAGALYGWGVFTTLGISGGAPRAFGRHWERLSAHAARARVPLDWPREAVESGLRDLVSRAGVVEGRARITVLRARGGPWQAAAGRESDAYVLVAARAPREAGPLALTVSPFRVNSGSPLAGLKTTAFAAQLLALDEARERGFDEALLLNERGEVVEAAAANLFWVRDGELYTPSLGTGCVAGVTRRIVLEAAARLRVRATEGSYTLGAVGDAEELFVTSSGWGLAPVSELDIHRYDPARGPVRARLAAAVEAILEKEG